MGLDMYLFKRKKVRDDDKDLNKSAYNQRLYRARKNEEEILYWRKANMIRSWFVNHTALLSDDDGVYIPISRATLELLKQDLEDTLNDHNLATVLFPTSNGFFFGDTEYNEYYWDKLKYTLERVNNILDNDVVDWENEVIEYCDSW